MLLIALVGVVQAQDDPAQVAHGLLIYNAWVRPTAPIPAEGATPEPPLPDTVTGAFMTIQNTSDQAYTLVSVGDDFTEMTQLHSMSMDGGVMKMQQVDGVGIPAGETVELATGGYHVMLMNVTRDLYEGETVALTLTFADASGASFDVAVGAVVTDYPADADTLIVANALATFTPATLPTHPGSLDIRLTLDNQGDAADTLVGVSKDDASDVTPLPSIKVSGQAVMPITLDGALLFGDDPPPEPADGAFSLVLHFDSGKMVTVGVPVVPAPDLEAAS